MIAFACVRASGLSGKTSGEITPGAIEKFKNARLHTVTKGKTKRSPASVKHEIDLLSRVFTLAGDLGLGLFQSRNRLAKSSCRINATGICYPTKNHDC